MDKDKRYIVFKCGSYLKAKQEGRSYIDFELGAPDEMYDDEGQPVYEVHFTVLRRHLPALIAFLASFVVEDEKWPESPKPRPQGDALFHAARLSGRAQ